MKGLEGVVIERLGVQDSNFLSCESPQVLI